MKKVVLKEMTLINFKGIRSLTVNFGQVTEIRGANATGKSTIADAFNWALFGKDAAGNSDSKFGIKTSDTDGNAIPKLDHEVTALLDVDGQTVELRRVLSEDWVTPRGKAEPELKGNSTAFFYNGIPLKEGEYNAKINQIIDEDLFRMITNPRYFPRLNWQVQREMLLHIAGGITLEEIANRRAEFSELIAQLSGKSIAEHKAEISARKKKIKEALDLIPARIDEVTRATPETPDFAALESEQQAAQKELQETEAALENVAEASRQEYEAQRKIQEEINKLRAKQQQTLFEAQQAARKEYNEKNREYEELIQRRDKTVKQIAELENEVERKKEGMRANLLKRADYNKQLERKREEWTKVNSEKFDECTVVCPTCGRELPPEKVNTIMSDWADTKKARLAQINTEGKKLNSLKAELEERNSGIRAEIAGNTERMQALQDDRDQLSEFIQESYEPKTFTEPTPDELHEYMNLEAKIIELSNSLQNRPANNSGNSELKAKKQELQTQLDGIKRQIALKKVINANNRRKVELLEEEKDLAQQKADLEKQEFIADSLVKEQMNEVERRVNIKFNLVRFKMFSRQINGGEKPDCILLAPDGAKFMDTNSAGQTAMGLDIINTLCEFNGVCAPIFIDNRESVTEIPPVINSQIINLIVDASCKKLTAKEI
jgi:DNA repair exonuclease SbcCD ATPase subunit